MVTVGLTDTVDRGQRVPLLTADMAPCENHEVDVTDITVVNPECNNKRPVMGTDRSRCKGRG